MAALSDLVDPAFQGEEPTDYYSLQLIAEVRVWAQTVRTRIEFARNSTSPRSTFRIGARQCSCDARDQFEPVLRDYQSDFTDLLVMIAAKASAESHKLLGLHRQDAVKPVLELSVADGTGILHGIDNRSTSWRATRPSATMVTS
jgi:hypothetical protein